MPARILRMLRIVEVFSCANKSPPRALSGEANYWLRVTGTPPIRVTGTPPIGDPQPQIHPPTAHARQFIAFAEKNGGRGKV